MRLDERRARVEVARTDGGHALAAALVELAEHEPLLEHRAGAIRALLVEAAGLCDGEPMDGSHALQGRILLRLGAVKMVEGDLEGAEQLIDRAFDRLNAVGDEHRLIEAGSVLARCQIRRKNLADAEALLARLAERVSEGVEIPAARRAATAIAIALAEHALESPGGEAAATERFRELAVGLAGDPDFLEGEYLSHQALGFLALARGDNAAACHALRAVVGLAKQVGALADELDSRVALAGALLARGDLAGREEAERHLQVARDTALEHGLHGQHMAALVGQAGLMARKGQTQGALDRCLEIARTSAARNDLTQYVAAVALMSEIYQNNGDFPSAYRALAGVHGTLKDKLGEGVEALILPHVRALSERMGSNKFREMIDNIFKAESARAEFLHEP